MRLKISESAEPLVLVSEVTAGNRKDKAANAGERACTVAAGSEQARRLWPPGHLYHCCPRDAHIPIWRAAGADGGLENEGSKNAKIF